MNSVSGLILALVMKSQHLFQKKSCKLLDVTLDEVGSMESKELVERSIDGCRAEEREKGSNDNEGQPGLFGVIYMDEISSLIIM